jgi:sugar phosphate isomerase/epimerase
MKYYANTWCYRDADRETTFRSLARLGFAGVEIIAHGPCFHADTLDTAAERAVSLSLLKELKLEVVAVSPSTEYLVFDMERRRQMVEHTMAITDMALAYGTKLVRIFAGGDIPQGRKKDECIEAVINGLRPCVDYAESVGAVLAVESHGRFGTDLEALVTILKEIQSPALGITLDTSNFAVNGVNPLDAIQAFGNRIYHTHLKDSVLGPEQRGTAVGEGSLDFEAILQALKKNAYQGVFCLEYEGDEHPDTGLQKGLAYVQQLVKKLAI